MIIVFGGQKGGTGKSTLAINTAAERVGQGRRVLMVDTDDQLTMTKWATRRRQKGIKPSIACVSMFGEAVSEEIMEQSGNYDDIIVDTHGGVTAEMVSALSVADRLITPTRTGQADLDTFAKVDQIIPQVRALNKKLQACIVLNMALTEQRVGNAKESLSHLKNFRVLDHVIRARVAFEDTHQSGMGVTEFERRNPEAVSELLLLSEEVWA
ncbi:division plane positioning ATPase MipZ [Cupriavidus metallidurans]|uniref:division plane positioning ATPase MipZ n=1 Tax=Cupriavidus metallidurans TaxID=119219 RepID=UPI001CCA4DEA|nr:division plane positioning ATPase MipZ [Cupriavidus metallidurans]UBM12729.1 AAA family ATPase [Cupriavidus metallidurans]